AAHWAGVDDARALSAWITEDDEAAIAVFRSCGFATTGERVKMPRSPGRIEARGTLALATDQVVTPRRGDCVSRGPRARRAHLSRPAFRRAASARPVVPSCAPGSTRRALLARRARGDHAGEGPGRTPRTLFSSEVT